MAQNMTVYMGSKKEDKKDEITYEVKQECGTLSTKTYTVKDEEVTEELKLRLVSWNNGEPKYEVRPWKYSSKGEQCGKMRGLNGEELIKLGEIINEMVKASEPKPKACKAKGNPTITSKPKKGNK